MSYEYAKAKPITLKDAGKDEKWLQDLISKDPSLLGLGDVILMQRERPQPTGGRIDLVLSDPDENLRYEVEVMLGATDESHIIRTIEYWDIERRRLPACDHRAVIVAERITNRFFNVIGLLNKAIPIIAIQINAFLMGDKLCLNFVRVLDVIEESDEDSGEVADRKYWEGRAGAKSLKLMDAIVDLVPNDSGELRVKYNRAHVAVGTSGSNFLWLHPRKAGYVTLHLNVGSDVRDKILSDLEDMGIECARHRLESIKVVITAKELENAEKMIESLIVDAEAKFRRS